MSSTTPSPTLRLLARILSLFTPALIVKLLFKKNPLKIRYSENGRIKTRLNGMESDTRLCGGCRVLNYLTQPRQSLSGCGLLLYLHVAPAARELVLTQDGSLGKLDKQSAFKDGQTCAFCVLLADGSSLPGTYNVGLI